MKTTLLLRSFQLHPQRIFDPEVARQVVDLIPDGATLQMGIGGLPGVVCSFLSHHNDYDLESY